MIFKMAMIENRILGNQPTNTGSKSIENPIFCPILVNARYKKETTMAVAISRARPLFLRIAENGMAKSITMILAKGNAYCP
jgi:hypothetical protein